LSCFSVDPDNCFSWAIVGRKGINKGGRKGKNKERVGREWNGGAVKGYQREVEKDGAEDWRRSGNEM
jgi:hypothetical protein